MNSSIKQIYVSLELGDNTLKMLVAEYFNTRFNILRVDTISSEAISDFKVIDKDLLVSDLKNLINNVSTKLGAKIEECILVLPTYNFKRHSLRSSIIPENKMVSKNDIARSITNSLKVNFNDDSMVINPMITRYTINGISTRRMPEKEVCDELFVDIDLLCADKEMVYEYVSCVEESGIKIVDICLNSYAICKEASLFEESLKQNLICLNIERNSTFLSLLSKGKLVSNEVIFDGINTLVRQIKLKYDIPEEDIIKLLKYDLNYDSEYLEDIVYAYNENNKTKTISLKDLNEVCAYPLEFLTDKLVTMCTPILEKGAMVFVTGEGQQISCLIKKLQDAMSSEIRSYFPDTIGVRDSNLTALYGSLFVYRDKVILNNLNVSCVDSLQYSKIVDKIELDSEGDTITSKIKNLFKQYIENRRD